MVTVSYYLKRPYDKNGKLKSTPVTITGRVNGGNGLRHDIPAELIDEKAIPLYWDSEKQRATRKDPAADLINKQLNSVTGNITTIYRENRNKSWAELCALFDGDAIAVEKKSLLKAFDEFVDSLRPDLDDGTIATYKALCPYLEKLGCPSVAAFDRKAIDALRALLFEAGLQQSSVDAYTVKIKTFLSRSRDNGQPVNEAYKKVKTRTRRKAVLFLTLEEIGKLESAILPRRASIARDYLVIACRTGQRISDIRRFDVRNFKDNKWTFWRRKGNRLKAKQVTVYFNYHLTKPALDILDRHKFELPKIKSLNYWIKIACRKAGITQSIPVEKWSKAEANYITTYVPKFKEMSIHKGRSTFATHASEDNSPQDLMDLMGIDDYETLRHYLGHKSVEDMERKLIGIGEKRKAS